MTKKMNNSVSTEDQVMAHVLAIQELLKVDCIIPEDKNYAFRIPLSFGSITDKKVLKGENRFFMNGQVIVYTPKKDAEIAQVKADKLASKEASKKAKTVKANASKVRGKALKTVKEAGHAVDNLERMERLLSAGFTHDQVAKAMDL